MKRLYCIYDRVAACILGSIIQESSDAPAIRAFHDALKSPQSQLSAHPADYDLLYLGDITTTGVIHNEGVCRLWWRLVERSWQVKPRS